MSMETAVCIAQQPEADALLTRSPLALLVGALLDRQIATESAFTGPLVIARRMATGHPPARAEEPPGAGRRRLSARSRLLCPGEPRDAARLACTLG
ncbi:hypothetical protein [Kitasatospora aureofaciens]|uniref:hypothetical protein n=1 Tax=Kitasatospora aureofaciens TaxID=1894 RepID=UPI003F4CC48B